MTRVAIAGVLGRLGTIAKKAIDAADDLTFAGGFARNDDRQARIYDDIGALLDRERPDVLLDVTTRPVSTGIAMRATTRGVPTVVGASGWTDAEVAALREAAERSGVGALLVPNFALGAVLMMRFAREAARFFPKAEIVETHHAGKLDAPSGTALATAASMGGDVPIHSLRLPGAVAHQEVVFGGEGELLSIRHDALSRDAFAGGIVAAVRAVVGLRGLHVGLDGIVG